MKISLKNIRRSKKGNAVLDAMFIVVLLITFTLAVIMIKEPYDEIHEAINADPNLSNESKAYMNDYHERYPKIFDGGFLTIFIFLWMAGIITSFFVDTHPIFFIIIVALLVIVLFVTGLLVNSYEEITDTDAYNSIKADFPKSHFIISNLVEVIIVVAASMTIALMSRRVIM